MASAAINTKTAMECDNDDVVSDAHGGKRPAPSAPPDEPLPARARPGDDGPHEVPPFDNNTQTHNTQHNTHPPEEDASAESLFGQSTHPSEGVTPHGPRTGSATARKPEGKVKKMGWLTVSCPDATRNKRTTKTLGRNAARWHDHEQNTLAAALRTIKII
ncbi:hypothetical protein AB1Y20_001017 [Prymnesium parvum]|uniref:Uncharacterized protein n=1 Tax=Prymnesium parvum TaxID=97485 RepID=A0AB34KCC1_PRYPA